MSVNALGPFTFTVLHRTDNPAGFPFLPRERVQTIERPGVVGTALLKLAAKSEPFQMRSGVDLDTTTEARTLIQLYTESIAQDAAFRMIWAGVDIEADYNTKYFVTDVSQMQYRRLAGSVGGQTSGIYWLEAIWTLQPVPA